VNTLRATERHLGSVLPATWHRWTCPTTNKQPHLSYCPSTAFLPVRPCCVNASWNRCQKDLNSIPFGEKLETTRTPSYYVDEDYPAGPEIDNLSLNEVIGCGRESSTLETDVYIWRALCTPSGAC